jgi:hypothetical protein
MRYRRKPKWQRPPKPFYHPETGRELTHAEQVQYWADLQAARVRAEEEKRAARWAALTPEQQAAQLRRQAEVDEAIRQDCLREQERRRQRAQEEYDRRHDPYSTFGT